MSDITRSTVSIRFRGYDLDPLNLSTLLGCSPSSAAKRSEELINSNGDIRVVKKGFWHLSYGDSDAIEIEEKIHLLLGKLTDDLNVWQMITQSVKADLFFELFLDGWNEGFELSPATLKKLSDRNLKIGFDIYSPTDSWKMEDEAEVEIIEPQTTPTEVS
ncbi:MAG: DUF4279 domain-containing protein [Anaerolineales bacterium]|nr:DUF4279 domain-containing protein [Anaerolineales bacterium]